MTQQQPPAFGNIFAGIMRAKPMTSYAARLGDGTHDVIIKKYRTKQSDPAKGAASMGTILEADFLVAASNDPAIREGDSRGWPWFIEGKGWAATYAQANAKEFIEAVMRSIDLAELPKNAAGHIVNPLTNQGFYQISEHGMPIIDPATGQVALKTEHDTMTIGELLAMGFFRGVQIKAIVSPAINKKTGQRITDSKGKGVSNAEWRPIPGQNLAGIAQVSAYLDTVDPPEVAPVQPNHAQTQQYGGHGGSGMGQFVAQQPQQAAPTQMGQSTYGQPVAPAPAPVQTQVQVQPAPVAAPNPSPAQGGGPLANVLAGLRKQG